MFLVQLVRPGINWSTDRGLGTTELWHTDLFQDQSEQIKHKSMSIRALQQNSRGVKQYPYNIKVLIKNTV